MAGEISEGGRATGRAEWEAKAIARKSVYSIQEAKCLENPGVPPCHCKPGMGHQTYTLKGHSSRSVKGFTSGHNDAEGKGARLEQECQGSQKRLDSKDIEELGYAGCRLSLLQ
jgi:hypothetical protein